MRIDTVYDLGGPDAAGRLRARVAGATVDRGPARRSASGPSWTAWLSASVALAIPGAGHVLLGRVRAGALWLGAVAVLGSVVVCTWSFLPRLWQAAAVLGLPSEASVWMLAGAAAGLALVHPASVLSARLLVPRGTPHPAIATSASAVVPGWGQLLNGDIVRAGVFLLAAWLAAGAWALASDPIQEILVAYRLRLPGPIDFLGTAPARWALLAAIWPLAAYDAGASARLARTRAAP
jgi:TM2 domain-containing membrane protein YozV